MTRDRAIDLSCLPFTHEMRAGPYQQHYLKDSLIKLGVWDDAFSSDDLLAAMDAAGVEKALMPAQAGGVWEVPYDVVARIAGDCAGRVYGLAGVDPSDIASGVRKLEHAVEELGFVGAHSYPHWFALPPDDRAYYPFYMKCIELDVPVQIQVGQAFQRGLRSVGRPEAIDAIAVQFPELRVVGIHTGYPWEREMVSVSWKHPNVFIGADTHHPRNWASELVDFIRGDGREKVLFGTNYPCLDFADALAGVAALGLDDATRAALLYENTARVFRIGD